MTKAGGEAASRSLGETGCSVFIDDRAPSMDGSKVRALLRSGIASRYSRLLLRPIPVDNPI